MSSNPCNYTNCFDCVRVLYPLDCRWNLSIHHCYNAESSSSSNGVNTWRDCPGTCCSKYTSCDSCIEDDDFCPFENCVWDLDNNVCVDTVEDGRPDNYADFWGDTGCDDTSILISTAAIIGICVGIGVLCLLSVLTFILWEHRRRRRIMNNKRTVEPGNIGPQPVPVPLTKTQPQVIKPAVNIKYVDQNGNPVAGPVSQIRYVDQYGNPYVNDRYIHIE